jgi:hypothetical protein
MLQMDYYRKSSVEKNSGPGSQGAWRQDELIGYKPAVVNFDFDLKRASLQKFCRQTDQSAFGAAVKGSPLMEACKVEEAPFDKSLRNITEFVGETISGQ